MYRCFRPTCRLPLLKTGPRRPSRPLKSTLRRNCRTSARALLWLKLNLFVCLSVPIYRSHSWDWRLEMKGWLLVKHLNFFFFGQKINLLTKICLEHYNSKFGNSFYIAMAFIKIQLGSTTGLDTEDFRYPKIDVFSHPEPIADNPVIIFTCLDDDL